MAGTKVTRATEFGGLAGSYENTEQTGGVVEPHLAARAMRETNSADVESQPRVGKSTKAS